MGGGVGGGVSGSVGPLLEQRRDERVEEVVEPYEPFATKEVQILRPQLAANGL